MSSMPSNWHQIARQDAARARTNPVNSGRPPRRPPYISELLAVPLVQRALEEAWRDTRADDSAHGNPNAIEQGGWIYINLLGGQVTVRRAPAHSFNEIGLEPPDIVPGSVVVGTFHTHPMDPFTGPSDYDSLLAGQYGVPGIVLGRNGDVRIVGPEQREGDWGRAASQPGFPQ